MSTAEKAAGTGALAAGALAAVLFSLGVAPGGWCALALAVIAAGWCLFRAQRRASAVLADADRDIAAGRKAKGQPDRDRAA